MGNHRLTISVPDEEFEEFKKGLDALKSTLGEQSTSSAIRILVKMFPDLNFKVEKYDQICEMFLAYETLRKYRKGELVHAKEERTSY